MSQSWLRTMHQSDFEKIGSLGPVTIEASWGVPSDETTEPWRHLAFWRVQF
jgi:hypothetical protein